MLEMKKLFWILVAFFAIVIGFFPLAYLFSDMSLGLLATKSAELLADWLWQLPFYVHMAFGGLALLVGWPQFNKNWRRKSLPLHRKLGMLYMLSVLIAGSTGLIIAANATGGLISQLGFSALGILWLFTTAKGYRSIRHLKLLQHENWMIRSYALCFAAVSLRLWIPIFMFLFGMEFYPSYQIISWLCWVPNLLVAEMIIYFKSGSAFIKA